MGDTWITDMSHFDYKDEEAEMIPISLFLFCAHIDTMSVNGVYIGGKAIISNHY